MMKARRIIIECHRSCSIRKLRAQSHKCLRNHGAFRRALPQRSCSGCAETCSRGVFRGASGKLVNLLRKERTSLRASKRVFQHVCTCHHNRMTSSSSVHNLCSRRRSSGQGLKRTGPTVRFRITNAFPACTRKVTKSQYTEIPWRAARSLQLSHYIRSMCRLAPSCV